MTQVPFLDVAGAARWIRGAGPENVLADLTDALAADFARWPSFELAPRLAHHSPVGVIELMPTSDGELFAFKYVNGHPLNPARGLQTVTAFGMLAEVATGYPTFVAEMTLLTALRTAATSALAARHLAPPGGRPMAFLGAGAQAEFQALALRPVLGTSTVQAFDPDPDAVAKLVRNLTPAGFEVRPCGDADQAVAGAGVVTTCTAAKRHAQVLTRSMLSSGVLAGGVHVNAVGGDCPGKTELDPTVLDDAHVVVELEPQTRVEGEVQLRPDVQVTELWRLVRGEAPGRTHAGQVTVFDSVGVAVEDFTVLRFAQDATVGTELVRGLDLVAAPSSPKDLFGAYLTGPA